MRTESYHREVRKVQFTDKSAYVLPGRNFELADKILDTAKNIRTPGDDVTITIKK